MDQTIKDSVAWLKDLAHPGAHLRLDSREVKPGDIFCAVPGEKVDGRTFIRVAAARGAAGVIYEAETSQRPEHYPLPAKPVEHLRERLGEIAARFYDEPSAHMTGVAVTGTNGKTTTTFWTASLLTALGSPSGIIGTVGVFFAGRQIPAPHLTTPDAASLQGILKDLEEAGAKSFVMEASSVGLDQGRMKGTHFKVGVFTNLSRDHLDYHQTMEAYGEAKGLLFAWPGLKAAVLNASDAWSRKYADAAQKNGSEIWVTGLEGEAASFGQAFGAAHVLEAKQIEPSHRGMRFTLVCDKREFPVELHALGTFNVDNALEAAAAAAACGHPIEKVVRALEALTPPPGRMQIFESDGMPLGVVDFGHTPDALEKAIECPIPNARARADGYGRFSAAAVTAMPASGRSWAKLPHGFPIKSSLRVTILGRKILRRLSMRSCRAYRLYRVLISGQWPLLTAARRFIVPFLPLTLKTSSSLPAKGMNANRSSMTGRTISLTERCFARLLMNAAQSAAGSKKKYPIDCKGVLA